MGRMKQKFKDEKKLTVIVQIREVFGRDLIYPVNELSKGLLQLTRKKTWTVDELKHLRQIGFMVEYIPRYADLPQVGAE